MASNGNISSGRHSGAKDKALSASAIMSEDKDSMKKDFDPGSKGEAVGVLFLPEEVDIYVNKVTLEAYIFHGKEIDYDSLQHLEYNPKDYTVDVVKKDGSRVDLGVKIQWLVRPYFTKAEKINIVQTKDGDSVNGTLLPLIHKE